MKVINRDNKPHMFLVRQEIKDDKNKITYGEIIHKLIISGRNSIDKLNPNIMIINGYPITEVEDEIWEAVKRQNSHSYLLKGEEPYLYAAKNEKDAIAWAREFEKVKIHISPLTEADLKRAGFQNDATRGNMSGIGRL